MITLFAITIIFLILSTIVGIYNILKLVKKTNDYLTPFLIFTSSLSIILLTYSMLLQLKYM